MNNFGLSETENFRERTQAKEASNSKTPHESPEEKETVTLIE